MLRNLPQLPAFTIENSTIENNSRSQLFLSEHVVDFFSTAVSVAHPSLINGESFLHVNTSGSFVHHRSNLGVLTVMPVFEGDHFYVRSLGLKVYVQSANTFSYAVADGLQVVTTTSTRIRKYNEVTDTSFNSKLVVAGFQDTIFFHNNRTTASFTLNLSSPSAPATTVQSVVIPTSTVQRIVVNVL